jgi:hypothetical protein
MNGRAPTFVAGGIIGMAVMDDGLPVIPDPFLADHPPEAVPAFRVAVRPTIQAQGPLGLR